jgi:type II secretory pathway pseudopilin PulG
MTMVELCIVIVVLAILLVTAVAGLFRARLMSNEAAAIAGLRAIYSAQFSFTAGCAGATTPRR